ncbi:Uncharacterized protein APZ42_032487 [Daphnia magna]|uniref:Uncharacterized protein n=1 Tax=Daphnia magna TaxID=35525 RepID=A0A164LL45_9CRUS|nr:Uncharacterized protein APZ42_032487 [Daphnia magna]
MSSCPVCCVDERMRSVPVRFCLFLPLQSLFVFQMNCQGESSRVPSHVTSRHVVLHFSANLLGGYVCIKLALSELDC